MRYSLNIDYPLETIEASRKRMEASEEYGVPRGGECPTSEIA